MGIPPAPHPNESTDSRRARLNHGPLFVALTFTPVSLLDLAGVPRAVITTSCRFACWGPEYRTNQSNQFSPVSLFSFPTETDENRVVMWAAFWVRWSRSFRSGAETAPFADLHAVVQSYDETLIEQHGRSVG